MNIKKRETNIILNLLRKIFGIILMIAGLIGTLIPIPLVPFFLLFILGLAVFGVKKEKIDDFKLKIDKLKKKILKK